MTSAANRWLDFCESSARCAGLDWGVVGIRSCENSARGGVLPIVEKPPFFSYHGIHDGFSWIFASRAFCIGENASATVVELIVDLPRWHAFVATALCRRVGENAMNASTQRGGYSVIKRSAAREVWTIIRAHHA